MGDGLQDWESVLAHPLVKAKPKDHAALLGALKSRFSRGPGKGAKPAKSPTSNAKLLTRLMDACPCLFNQVKGKKATARATVHLCEVTIGQRITSANVHAAFFVQHPHKSSYLAPPVIPCTNGGAIMEMLCSEVLTAAGIPVMPLDAHNWPQWKLPGHILLNEGEMKGLRAFGDIMIPCAPTNLVISVKSEAARERLLYSSNAIEGVGFGFFNEAKEFWTIGRMQLYKRMGFTAIYMPKPTLDEVNAALSKRGTAAHAVNVNGTALYRSLEEFGTDMMKVVGRSSLIL